ncbi:MAG: hypothetical protein ACREOH_04690, partial [Candidatus Entotheonellia bacterium]
MPSEMVQDVKASATASATESHIHVETVTWVTRFVGGNGSDRVSFELTLKPGDTVRSALRRLSERFPQLQ